MILIVDDHAILRAGLHKLLSAVRREPVLEAASGREAMAEAIRHRLDLVILDMNLPDVGGLELLGRLRQASTARVLVLSMHAEPVYVRRALEAGAAGYISKAAPADELLRAVAGVLAGERYVEEGLLDSDAEADAAPAGLDGLTPRDLEILRQLGGGRSLGEIADALGLSYKTIANTCSAMKLKLGVSRTADLVRLALQAGLG